jgi:hypothetical protein
MHCLPDFNSANDTRKAIFVEEINLRWLALNAGTEFFKLAEGQGPTQRGIRLM